MNSNKVLSPSSTDAPGQARKHHYKHLKKPLQIELLKLQRWVKDTGQKVLIIFEGRDASGKGGTIKSLMEHLNPRGTRVVALEKPSEKEKGQWYFQRYIKHLPARGEIVILDRSWYNRAGVESVMGFCTPKEKMAFFQQVPALEAMLVQSDIQLPKSCNPSSGRPNTGIDQIFQTPVMLLSSKYWPFQWIFID